MAEWKRLQLVHKDKECKEGGSMRDCQCIDRIKFMLHHYANWVKIRTTKQMHQNGVKCFFSIFFMICVGFEFVNNDYFNLY